ncbi:outer membrane protein assembly factor [Vibrio sp. SCSIO 43135]|uniref:autotransporter assembly complex protein TamA n=1 Tax=Vibrio sp. SCSIO 43135 TaxID=2819096 RepID=UPI0020764DA9|nr:autotransporter assembly complex family protein [Vibrio sp. SCSIO 43135]USD43333.1 outer membrane protein assembly factor [Vibrio sp. SCSIO 43135]
MNCSEADLMVFHCRWLFFLLLVSSQALSFDYEVSGVSGELRKNIAYHLQPLQHKSINTRAVKKAVDSALHPYGFYHSTFELSQPSPNKVRVNVQAGEPILIAQADIVISGSASVDDDFHRLLDEAPIVGDVLNHKKYDTLKSNIQSLALKKGYFDGAFSSAQMEVSPSQNTARLTLHFESGERYKFGAITLLDSQIEEERVLGMKTFSQGDSFDSHLLSEYQARLAESGWYQNIQLSAKYEEVNDAFEIPIDVRVTPRAKNRVQLGAGYASSTGVRGSMRWEQPWYNDKGHSFESQVQLSVPEQSLTLGYKVPTAEVMDNYYGVKFRVKHLDYLDTLSLTSDLTFEKFWRIDQDWKSTVYLTYLYENYQQASQTDQTQLTLPGIRFQYEPEKPLIGNLSHRHDYSVEFSEPHLLSDSRVLRVIGSSNLSWLISPRNRLSVRASMGANITDDISELPSSLRFFAGGEGSIRGYKYDSISPTDESGELTGGRYMAALGMDIQTKLYKSIWGGAFFDIGDAYDSKVDWKRGVGVSLGWESKFLPIQLALGKGLDSTSDRFRVHLTLGAQF